MAEVDPHTVIEVLEKRILSLINDTDWICCKKMKDGSKILKKTTEKAPSIYMYNGRIPDTTVDKLTKLINPLAPYRILWDSQLREVSSVEELDGLLILRHFTKARLLGLVSERETLDLCKFSGDACSRTVIMTDTSHPSDVPKPGIVRARTILSYLILQQTEEGDSSNVNITALVQGDMAAYGVPNIITESVIPKGILRFFGDLRKASESELDLSVDYDMPHGWRIAA